MWLHGAVAVSTLLYVLVYVNLPTFLFASAEHDDGLFISHAYSIASGHWLGSFNELTLAKGPGYPIFLALLSLFKISAPLGHCLFYAFSVWLLAYATEKICHSVLLSILIFEVLLWHFGPHPMRIIRDTIVTPQILVVLSFLLLCLFAAKASGMVYSLLAGIAFAWFWITREDAVVFVPAILVLWGFAFQKAYRGGLKSLELPAKRLALFVGSAGAMVGTIALVNFIEYRTFTIVDVGGDFKSAFEALESVKPNLFVPYEGVAKSARDQVYKISPSFAKLQPLLDGRGQSTGDVEAVELQLVSEGVWRLCNGLVYVGVPAGRRIGWRLRKRTTSKQILSERK